jgi:hypothetical protein
LKIGWSNKDVFITAIARQGSSKVKKGSMRICIISRACEAEIDTRRLARQTDEYGGLAFCCDVGNRIVAQTKLRSRVLKNHKHEFIPPTRLDLDEHKFNKVTKTKIAALRL